MVLHRDHHRPHDTIGNVGRPRNEKEIAACYAGSHHSSPIYNRLNGGRLSAILSERPNVGSPVECRVRQPRTTRGAKASTRMIPVPWLNRSPAWAFAKQAVASIKIDQPHVRVTEYRFAPDAETGWHRHSHDYVVVPLLDGQLTLEQPDGSSRIAQLLTHQPYARRGCRAQRHQ